VNNVDAISVGFLDPILLAMRGHRQHPEDFRLCGYGYLFEGTETSLVTVRALCLFLESAVEFIGETQRVLVLQGLGLGDDHCQAVAELVVQNGMIELQRVLLVHSIWRETQRLVRKAMKISFGF
jgi:hypothetical protein